MTTPIWKQDQAGWHLLSPSGFPNEDALHGLVEQAPQILPLSGNPTLTVVGREVALGGNYADLIAIEPNGRLVVVEIKLARNAEARRAVVAQVLTYAAYLRGLNIPAVEELLASHLSSRGFNTLLGAVQATDQEGAIDAESFVQELTYTLMEGRFRLVLVLDEVPTELVRLVGYLEAVADKLIIDIITVASYEIAGSQVIIPQRIDPEQQVILPSSPPKVTTAPRGQLLPGSEEFEANIDLCPEDQRDQLRRLIVWAKQLENEGLVRLSTFRGKSGRLSLLPWLLSEKGGLVTIWNDRGVSISFWRSVFERRAPKCMPRVEELIGTTIGQGNTIRSASEALLEALTDAYREAATSQLTVRPAAHL